MSHPLTQMVLTIYARFSAVRILQLCSAREIGGGEKHLADLANSLADRGHEIFAAIAPNAPVRAELDRLPAQNIIELPMRNALSLRSAMRLARFVRRHGIELIHAHLARDYPLAALASGRSGASLVLTRHVLFPLSKIHRLTLRRTARVIAVSQAVADGLRSQNVFSQDTIETIHNGIDFEKFAQRTKRAIIDQDVASPHRMRVGTIGHLAPIKGQEEFIRAAALVRQTHNEVEFIIAGEDKSRGGENRATLEQLIDNLDLKDRVHLTGWIEDVAELLATFDLFVSAARSEPFGLAIVEAMAAGVPVIATVSEGASEILDDNQTGRLVPVGDANALAGAIIDLLDDAEERSRLAETARRAAHERFSLERMVDRTEQVYRTVIESR